MENISCSSAFWIKADKVKPEEVKHENHKGKENLTWRMQVRANLLIISMPFFGSHEINRG